MPRHPPPLPPSKDIAVLSLTQLLQCPMMIIDRLQCVRGLMASLLAVCAENNKVASPLHPTPAATFHPPPPGVDYEDNDTVFGSILRGELPAVAYAESEDLLVFRDRWPRALLHGLVIPKKCIKSVRNLSQHDIGLILSMKATALGVIKQEQPTAYQQEDYILCFHIAPFNSVNHLHLHVLAPASEMDYWMRYSKYKSGTLWCTSVDDVIARLKMGKSAV